MGFSRSIGVLTSIKFLSAIVAVTNTVLIVYLFGTGHEIEVYFAAVQILLMFISLTQAGQIGEIFIPKYLQVKHTSNIEIAREYFSIVINWMVITLLMISALAYAASPYIVSLMVPGFSEEKQQLVLNMFLWMLPLIFFQVLFAFFKMLANAERLFGRPELIMFWAACISIITLAVTFQALGVWAMVLSLWVGILFKCIYMILVMVKAGYKHYFGFSKDDFSIISIVKRLGYSLTYIGATQIFLIFLSAGLSQLPQGLYAVFKYVQQLYSKTNGILLIPVSTVYFTHVSEKIASGSEGVIQLAKTALSKFLLVVVPAILLISLFATDVLSILWGGDKFPKEHLELASNLLIIMFSLMLLEGLYAIFRKTNLANGKFEKQYLYASFAQLISAGAAILLLPEYGINGVLFVLFINISILASLSAYVLWHENRLVIFYEISNLIKWLISGIVTYLISYQLVLVMRDILEVENKIDSVIFLAICTPVVVIVLLVLSYIINISDVKGLVRMIYNKVIIR